MPRPLSASDPVPQVPDIGALSFFDEYKPPWLDNLSVAPVDVIRTEALRDWEVLRDGKVIPVRVSGNTPLQLAGTTYTTVHERLVKGTLRNPFPSVKVPLPQKVWVSSNNDHTVFIIDTLRRFYYELSACGPLWPFVGSPWVANNVRVFNLDKPWTQEGSISASRIPVWALVPTVEELNAGAGGVKRALPFVAAGYGVGTPIWPSRGTDGYIVGHPLANGTRLRFTAKAVERLAPLAKTRQDTAILWAGQQHGFINVDKTSEDAGHALRLPNDPRLNITLRFTLADLEVVYG
jgi:hypothetical protein